MNESRNFGDLPDLLQLINLECGSSEDEIETGSHFGLCQIGPTGGDDMLNKTICEADFEPLDE